MKVISIQIGMKIKNIQSTQKESENK
jgi:hypothetical protein